MLVDCLNPSIKRPKEGMPWIPQRFYVTGFNSSELLFSKQKDKFVEPGQLKFFSLSASCWTHGEYCGTKYLFFKNISWERALVG